MKLRNGSKAWPCHVDAGRGTDLMQAVFIKETLKLRSFKWESQGQNPNWET